jgi:glucan 1,3-beta-glucosidase
MRFLQLFPLLSAALALSPAVELEIPAVSSAVSSQLSKFSAYVQYAGPTGVPAPAAASPSATASNAQSKRAAGQPYWMEQIAHQGYASFNPNSEYKVFRNVKDYGAKGWVQLAGQRMGSMYWDWNRDGVTDDTAAIQNAISSGGRCAPGVCQSTTTSPAVIYFPGGTYIISSSIIDYYYTQLIGNPNDVPVLKATAGLTGFGVIDGDQYQPGGVLGYGGTNLFWRQIRNFVIDMTAIPPSSSATGIHWPAAQATSLQNIVFQMSAAQGTQHQGVFIESGSGGFMADLTFNGGLNGVVFGNQQYVSLGDFGVNDCRF